jgi:predicted nucleic acid-binding protein
MFHIADEDAAVTNFLLALLASNAIRGKQIHDANIVATMKRYGIRLLLTHNTADFTRYTPEIDILPLVF